MLLLRVQRSGYGICWPSKATLKRSSTPFDMYDNGQGVPRNDAQAIKWYRKAAEQGDAVAQFNLGVMYAKGEGVPHNYGEAEIGIALPPIRV
jgi:Sel1 repeat